MYYAKLSCVLGILLTFTNFVFGYDTLVYTDGFGYNQTTYETKWTAVSGCVRPALVSTKNHDYSGTNAVVADGSAKAALTTLASAITSGYIQLWFYDGMAANDYGVVMAGRNPYATGYSAVGLYPGCDMNYYHFFRSDTGTWTNTNILRSRGWHKVVFTFFSGGGDIYLDDFLMATNAQMTQCQWVQVGNPWGNTGVSLYYDDLTTWTMDTNYNTTVSDNGTTVILSNGFSSAGYTKSNATMNSLTEWGSQLLSGGEGFFDMTLNGGNFYRPFDSGATYTLVRNNPFCAVIKWRRESTASVPFVIELYQIMLRNKHGFYTYAEFWHDGTAPNCSYEQAEFVIRPSSTIFNYHIADDNRITQMPTPSQIQYGTLQYGGCFLLQGGTSYYDKYWYSVCKKDNNLYGMTGVTGGSTYGIWNIFASDEFFTGGPLKQTPSVHQSPVGPILLAQFHDCHYLGSDAVATMNSNWGKCYGPVFTYLNGAADRATAYSDAKSQRDKELINWPYTWLSDRTNYYPMNRGSVTGTLNITDGTSENGAIIVLAQSSPYWQFQSKDYIRYAKCDASGNFSIENVRAGSYTLYSFVSGAIGEFTYGSTVNVSAGSTTSLGTINWTPSSYGTKIWEIGTPDRSCEEFKRGNQTWSQTAWLWNNYISDFPSGVTYTIGSSTPANNWFYVQVPYYSGGIWIAPEWRINFSLTAGQVRASVLRVAIASGAYGSGLKVKVNGNVVYDTSETPCDQAYIYNSTFAVGRTRDISIPANTLVNGSNYITVQQTWAGSNFYSGISYDYLRFEQ